MHFVTHSRYSDSTGIEPLSNRLLIVSVVLTDSQR